MKTKAIAIGAVLAMCLMAFAGLSAVSDETDADVSPSNINGSFVARVQCGVEEKIYLLGKWSGYGSEYYWPDSLSVTGSVPGMTLRTETGNYYTDTPYTSNYAYHDLIKNIILEGTPTAPGNYYISVTVKSLMCEGPWYTLSRNIVIEVAEPTHDHTVAYDANGGTGSMANTVVTDTSTGSSNVTLAANGFAKAGHAFSGWHVNGSVLQPGQTVSVGADATVTAVAQWEAFALSTSANNISGVSGLSYSNQIGASATHGGSVSYAIKSCTGGTASVNSTGLVTYNSPTVSSTVSHTVTVTVTASYADGTVLTEDVSFSVTVDPVLSFTNAATSGTLSVKGA